MTRPHAAFAALCVIFGTTFAAIAIGLRDGWPPLLAAGARFTLAGLVVLGAARAFGPFPRVAPREWRILIFVGLTVTGATFGALYTAETALPSGLAALVSATSPLFAFGMAVSLRMRRLDAFAIGGIVLGMVGVALVVGIDGARIGPAAVWGAITIIVSEVAYAGGLTAAKASRLPTLLLAGGQQLFGGLVLLVLSLVFEHRGPARIDGAGIAALAYLTLVGSAGGHTIGIWLAKTSGATFASSWTYIAPFVALLAGALLLHEPIGIAAWAGGACVVAGCLALNRDQLTFFGATRGGFRPLPGVHGTQRFSGPGQHRSRVRDGS